MSRHTARNVATWTLQGLLAVLFLFAGGIKLVLPAATLARMAPLAPGFLKFIGVCEVAGALGLILPRLFKVWQFLTPLAALGLAIIMVGAVVVSAVIQGVSAAVMPALVGIAALTIVQLRREPRIIRSQRTRLGHQFA